jgi:RNA polymerase sigma-70 factor (ECF subfamily)
MTEIESLRSANPRRGGAPDLEKRGRERELIQRAQAGDVTAFEQLYRDNVRRIYATCLRLCGDATRAEELTQDAFVRAWEKLPGFRGDSAFSSWLHPLAVNLALTQRRARLRYEARVTSTDDVAAYERARAGSSTEAGLDVQRALDVLPPGARAVFVLHDVEGYKHGEIAALTGVATGTSKAQLHRARRLMREALQ